jgi:hypothetical protein
MPPMGKKKKPLASREELIQYLEQVSGRSIRTRDDIKAYVEEMAARKAADEPSVIWWRRAKTATLIGLTVQIMALRETTFFVPVSVPMVKSMLQTDPKS